MGNILNGGISRLHSIDVVPSGRLLTVDIVRPVADAHNLVESSQWRTGDGHAATKVVADVKDPTVKGGVSVVAHRAIGTAEGELARNGKRSGSWGCRRRRRRRNGPKRSKCRRH